MPTLTKRLIDATPYPKTGQVFVRDDALKGFALRVTRGSKSFVVEKMIKGRVRRLTIGPYGPFTLEQARKEAHAKIHDIYNGEDPTIARREALHAPTFHDLETRYLADHAAHKKSQRNDINLINTYLAGWRRRQLPSITRPEVARLHSTIGTAHPYQANRLLALIRVMFNLAATWGLYRGENPAAGIKGFREHKRDRFVRPQELPALFAAVQQEPSVYVRGAFFIALLTGARRGEVLRMRWTDLDLREGVWRISDTKAGRPHLIPLPRPVMDELAKLPRLEGNPYVFPGRRRGGPLINVSKAWKRMKQAAKLEDVRFHDLRRTLGSWLAASGASLPLIGKALSHSQPSTTAIYARLDLDPVRVALEANATRMLTVVDEAKKQTDAAKKSVATTKKKHERGSSRETQNLSAIQDALSLGIEGER